MSKVTLLFFYVLIVTKGIAQGRSEYSDFNIPTKEGQAFYETIDSTGCKGKEKGTIYLAGRKAFSDLFKNLNAVIQMDDKEGGAIVGKGVYELNHKIQLGVKETTTIQFTVNFQCKDGKYRLQFYDFSTKASVHNSFSPLDKMQVAAKGYRTRFFPEFNSQTQLLIENFRNTVLKNLGEDF